MSLLRPHPCRLPIRTSRRTSRRTFSTTPSLPASLQLERNDPEVVADTVPAYPHGPARWYKQSNKGLYGGQRIQFGNNVSGDFNTKTRRTFQVNVLSKRLWSHALDRFVQLRVTARTLRTIDRVGGLDEYLLGDKEGRIKQLGVSGWWLRWAIMQQPVIKERFRQERYDLGLELRGEYESKLKELETSHVGADLEAAYAALPEEEAEAAELAEATAASEELPETSSDGSLITMDGPHESQALPSDDSIGVSIPSDMPALKFRTGLRTHVVLGPHGWVRTRPNNPEYAKQWIAKNKYPDYVASKMAIFKSELATLREKEMPEMRLAEEKEILRAARRRFTKELEDRADMSVEMSRMRKVEKRSNRERHESEGAVAREQRGDEGKVEGLAKREPDALDSAAM